MGASCPKLLLTSKSRQHPTLCPWAHVTMDGYDFNVGGVDWLRILLILAVGFVAGT